MALLHTKYNMPLDLGAIINIFAGQHPRRMTMQLYITCSTSYKKDFLPQSYFFHYSLQLVSIERVCKVRAYTEHDRLRFSKSERCEIQKIFRATRGGAPLHSWPGLLETSSVNSCLRPCLFRKRFRGASAAMRTWRHVSRTVCLEVCYLCI